LSALATVVKRQSGLMEVSGEGVRHLATNGVTSGNGEPGLGKSEGAPSAAPRSRTAGAQDSALQRSDTEASKAARAGHRLASAPEVEAPAADGDDTVQTKLARNTDRLVSKLNGVARELVRALDKGLDEELEGRFRAGEAYVYTHRLYLARTKLEAEIAERYAAEEDIRNRTDGFVGLFERLLARVSASPQGQELVDACLGSESGKVYLMLARASGRIQGE
jgi:hypothetical protein